MILITLGTLGGAMIFHPSTVQPSSSDVHCPACPYVGPALSFDVINYDSDVDYLICPVCGEEFRK